MSEPSDEPEVAVVSSIVAMVEADTAERREADGRGPGWRHATFAMLIASSGLCFSLHPVTLQKALAEETSSGAAAADVRRLGLLLAALGGGVLTLRIGAKRAALVATNIGTFAAFLLLLAEPLPWVGLAVELAAGCATGMLLPAQLALVTAWAPRSGRGLVVCLVLSGQDLGSCLSTLLAGPLDSACPWCFGAFWGCLGIIWIFAFSVFAASWPELHKACTSSGETAWIAFHRGDKDDLSLRPSLPVAPLLVLLLRQPATWALAFSQFACSSFTRTEVLEVTEDFAGGSRWDRVGVQVAGAAGCILAGCWSYVAGRRGWRPELWPKALQVFGSLLCLALWLSSPNLTVDGRQSRLCLWASVSILRAQFAALLVHMVYATPELASLLLGLTTAFAAFSSLVVGQGPWGLSKAVESSWLLLIAGSMNFFAACLFVKYGFLGAGTVSLDRALKVGLQAELGAEAAAGAPAGFKQSACKSLGSDSCGKDGNPEVDLEAGVVALDSMHGPRKTAAVLDLDLGVGVGSLVLHSSDDINIVHVECECEGNHGCSHCLQTPGSKRRNVVSLEDGLAVIMDLEEQGLGFFGTEADTQGTTRSSSTHRTRMSLD